MAKRPRQTPRHELPLLQLLPNFLTVGAICAGLTAIRFAFQGNYELAVALIVLAAAIDGIDGRIARLLKSESAIGAELDSLADFVNFGVAPGLILYLWALQDARSGGWIVVLLFAICCVLRLARFNVGLKAGNGDGRFFTGVPAPAGALVVLLPLYISELMPTEPRFPPLAVGTYMVAIGLLMISRLPSPALKSVTVYPENAKFVVIGFVALGAALLTYPWATLVLLSLVYLLSLIWAWRAKRRLPTPPETTAGT